jgi:RNA polymerase sigma-32 factor
MGTGFRLPDACRSGAAMNKRRTSSKLTRQARKQSRLMCDELPVLQDTAHAYFVQIRKIPLLSAEQNNALAVRYWETGDKKYAFSLATSNLRLVVKIAMEFQRKWMFDFMDVIQEGNVGLVQAIQKYDPFRGVKFSYYAAYWIKAHILKFIIDNFRMVKLGTSNTERRLFYNLRKEKNRLEKMGFAPKPEQLAQALATDSEKIIAMEQRLSNNEISLEACMAGSRDVPYTCISSHGLLDNALAEQELSCLVMEKIQNFKTLLDPRKQDIFDRRILSDNPATLQTIGKRHGITKERVRQIEKGLKTAVGKYLQDEYPELLQPLSPVCLQHTLGQSGYMS